MIDLKANPFYLDEEQIAWVTSTLKNMTLQEKAEQVICPLSYTTDSAYLKDLVTKHSFGGIMFRVGLQRRYRMH